MVEAAEQALPRREVTGNLEDVAWRVAEDAIKVTNRQGRHMCLPKEVQRQVVGGGAPVRADIHDVYIAPRPTLQRMAANPSGRR